MIKKDDILTNKSLCDLLRAHSSNMPNYKYLMLKAAERIEEQARLVRFCIEEEDRKNLDKIISEMPKGKSFEEFISAVNMPEINREYLWIRWSYDYERKTNAGER